MPVRVDGIDRPLLCDSLVHSQHLSHDDVAARTDRIQFHHPVVLDHVEVLSYGCKSHLVQGLSIEGETLPEPPQCNLSGFFVRDDGVRAYVPLQLVMEPPPKAALLVAEEANAVTNEIVLRGEYSCLSVLVFGSPLMPGSAELEKGRKRSVPAELLPEVDHELLRRLKIRRLTSITPDLPLSPLLPKPAAVTLAARHVRQRVIQAEQAMVPFSTPHQVLVKRDPNGDASHGADEEVERCLAVVEETFASSSPVAAVDLPDQLQTLTQELERAIAAQHDTIGAVWPHREGGSCFLSSSPSTLARIASIAARSLVWAHEKVEADGSGGVGEATKLIYGAAAVNRVVLCVNRRSMAREWLAGGGMGALVDLMCREGMGTRLKVALLGVLVEATNHADAVEYLLGSRRADEATPLQGIVHSLLTVNKAAVTWVPLQSGFRVVLQRVQLFDRLARLSAVAKELATAREQQAHKDDALLARWVDAIGAVESAYAEMEPHLHPTHPARMAADASLPDDASRQEYFDAVTCCQPSMPVYLQSYMQRHRTILSVSYLLMEASGSETALELHTYETPTAAASPSPLDTHPPQLLVSLVAACSKLVHMLLRCSGAMEVLCSAPAPLHVLLNTATQTKGTPQAVKQEAKGDQATGDGCIPSINALTEEKGAAASGSLSGSSGCLPPLYYVVSVLGHHMQAARLAGQLLESGTEPSIDLLQRIDLLLGSPEGRLAVLRVFSEPALVRHVGECVYATMCRLVPDHPLLSQQGKREAKKKRFASHMDQATTPPTAKQEDLATLRHWVALCHFLLSSDELTTTTRTLMPTLLPVTRTLMDISSHADQLQQANKSEDECCLALTPIDELMPAEGGSKEGENLTTGICIGGDQKWTLPKLVANDMRLKASVSEVAHYLEGFRLDKKDTGRTSSQPPSHTSSPQMATAPGSPADAATGTHLVVRTPSVPDIIQTIRSLADPSQCRPLARAKEGARDEVAARMGGMDWATATHLLDIDYSKTDPTDELGPLNDIDRELPSDSESIIALNVAVRQLRWHTLTAVGGLGKIDSIGSGVGKSLMAQEKARELHGLLGALDGEGAVRAAEEMARELAEKGLAVLAGLVVSCAAAMGPNPTTAGLQDMVMHSGQGLGAWITSAHKHLPLLRSALQVVSGSLALIRKTSNVQALRCTPLLQAMLVVAQRLTCMPPLLTIPHSKPPSPADPDPFDMAALATNIRTCIELTADIAARLYSFPLSRSMMIRTLVRHGTLLPASSAAVLLLVGACKGWGSWLPAAPHVFGLGEGERPPMVKGGMEVAQEWMERSEGDGRIDIPSSITLSCDILPTPRPSRSPSLIDDALNDQDDQPPLPLLHLTCQITLTGNDTAQRGGSRLGCLSVGKEWRVGIARRDDGWIGLEEETWRDVCGAIEGQDGANEMDVVGDPGDPLWEVAKRHMDGMRGDMEAQWKKYKTLQRALRLNESVHMEDLGALMSFIAHSASTSSPLLHSVAALATVPLLDTGLPILALAVEMSNRELLSGSSALYTTPQTANHSGQGTPRVSPQASSVSVSSAAPAESQRRACRLLSFFETIALLPTSATPLSPSQMIAALEPLIRHLNILLSHKGYPPAHADAIYRFTIRAFKAVGWRCINEGSREGSDRSPFEIAASYRLMCKALSSVLNRTSDDKGSTPMSRESEPLPSISTVLEGLRCLLLFTSRRSCLLPFLFDMALGEGRQGEGVGKVRVNLSSALKLHGVMQRVGMEIAALLDKLRGNDTSTKQKADRMSRERLSLEAALDQWLEATQLLLILSNRVVDCTPSPLPLLKAALSDSGVDSPWDTAKTTSTQQQQPSQAAALDEGDDIYGGIFEASSVSPKATSPSQAHHMLPSSAKPPLEVLDEAVRSVEAFYQEEGSDANVSSPLTLCHVRAVDVRGSLQQLRDKAMNNASDDKAPTSLPSSVLDVSASFSLEQSLHVDLFAAHCSPPTGQAFHPYAHGLIVSTSYRTGERMTGGAGMIDTVEPDATDDLCGNGMDWAGGDKDSDGQGAREAVQWVFQRAKELERSTGWRSVARRESIPYRPKDAVPQQVPGAPPMLPCNFLFQPDAIGKAPFMRPPGTTDDSGRSQPPRPGFPPSQQPPAPRPFPPPSRQYDATDTFRMRRARRDLSRPPSKHVDDFEKGNNTAKIPTPPGPSPSRPPPDVPMPQAPVAIDRPWRPPVAPAPTPPRSQEVKVDAGAATDRRQQAPSAAAAPPKQAIQLQPENGFDEQGGAIVQPPATTPSAPITFRPSMPPPAMMAAMAAGMQAGPPSGMHDETQQPTQTGTPTGGPPHVSAPPAQSAPAGNAIEEILRKLPGWDVLVAEGAKQNIDVLDFLRDPKKHRDPRLKMKMGKVLETNPQMSHILRMANLHF
ncbi:unnamed protein product [Vitrella brassicaformis CCMP3155]|uniref:Virilizer N-terminal domain-containing protein n=4 Tax=Vitrella brassicaformis TaxID=1169539 RepID=A0A0G4GA28_VITBC|nr:unnamed protein product [Vitrella brassicaformis CCMP3155]|eukprot:CEM25402.1 unnamed protein product [Vitrella brassicaformis CCMP3155]